MRVIGAPQGHMYGRAAEGHRDKGNRQGDTWFGAHGQGLRAQRMWEQGEPQKHMYRRAAEGHMDCKGDGDRLGARSCDVTLP